MGFQDMTPEERFAAQSKGGKRTFKEFKKNRGMGDTLKLLLSMAMDSGKVQDLESIKAFGKLAGKNITVNDAVCIRLVQRAIKGDLKAIEMLRDTVGEKPSDSINVADITPIVLTGEGDIRE